MLPYKIHVLIQEYEPDSLSIGASEKRIALNAPVSNEINAIDCELRARGRLRSLSPNGMHD